MAPAQQATKADIQALGARMSSLEKRMSNFETRMSSVEKTVARLEAQVSNLDRRVAKIETQISNLDAQVAKVETEVSNLNITVKEMDKHLSTIINILIGVVLAAIALPQLLGYLQGRRERAELQKLIEIVNQRVDQHQREIEELKLRRIVTPS